MWDSFGVKFPRAFTRNVESVTDATITPNVDSRANWVQALKRIFEYFLFFFHGEPIKQPRTAISGWTQIDSAGRERHEMKF